MASSRRAQRCSRSWIIILLVVSLLPLAAARRVQIKGQGAGSRALGVKDLPLQGSLFHREDTNGFPGAKFYQDGDGEDEFGAYAWNDLHQMKRNGGDWKWRNHKPKSSTGFEECSSKKSKKSSAPSSSFPPSLFPSESSAPTTTISPSNVPSTSLKPTLTAMPTTSKKSKKSSAPTTTISPSFFPSESLAPSLSSSPTNLPSESPRPTVTAMPTKSRKGKGSSKKGRCTPTVSPTVIRSTKAPSSSSSKSGGTLPDDGLTCNLIKEGDRPSGDADLQFDVSIGIEPTSERSDVANLLDGGLETVIALWIAGCEDTANALFETLRRRSSRMLADQEVEFVGWKGTWAVGKLLPFGFG